MFAVKGRRTQAPRGFLSASSPSRFGLARDGFRIHGRSGICYNPDTMPAGVYHRSTIEERFWRKVQKTETCWLWVGYRNEDGYGSIRMQGRPEFVHRVAFAMAGTPLNPLQEVHHACPNKNCVRVHPAHLVIVPRYKNPDSAPQLNRAKTHCKHGHPFSGQNLGMESRGKRYCKICNREKAARFRSASLSRLRTACDSLLQVHPAGPECAVDRRE